MFANHVNNLVRATTNNIKISVVFAEGYFEGLDDNRCKKPVLEIMQWLIHKNNLENICSREFVMFGMITAFNEES